MLYYNTLTRTTAINNPFILMNNSDVWRTAAVDEDRISLTPALAERQHPHTEDILGDALEGRFGTLIGQGVYSRVYDTSDPQLVVKQICNVSGSDERIGLTFDTLELNIAAGRIAHQLSLGKHFDRWRLTAPKIHAAVIRSEMVDNRQLNPSADQEPPENEHLFIVMDKLPLLPIESVQSDICANTFPSSTQVAAALSVGLQVEVMDIDESWESPGLKTLTNMGVLRTPMPSAEPGLIAVYDLERYTF